MPMSVKPRTVVGHAVRVEERAFWDRLDAGVVRARDASDPWDAYERALEVAGEANDQMLTTQIAAPVYLLWESLTDLFDDQRLGRIPAMGAQFLLREAAEDWLATPIPGRDRLIDEWLVRDWVAMIKQAGFRVGPPPNPRVEQPWRGQWNDIAWVIGQIGVTHSTFAAGERVLRNIADDPILWDAGSGVVLESLLRQWEAMKERRPQLDVAIRKHLLTLRAGDVPALQPLDWPED